MLYINALVLSALIVAFALSVRIHLQSNKSFSGPAHLAHVARRLNYDQRIISYAVCISFSIHIVGDLLNIGDKTWAMTGFNVAFAACVLFLFYCDSSFNPEEEYPELFAREKEGDGFAKKDGAA